MVNDKKLTKSYIACVVLAAIVLTAVIGMFFIEGITPDFYLADRGGITVKKVYEFFMGISGAKKALCIAGGFVSVILLSAIGIYAYKAPQKLWDGLYKYRYVIALIIFAVCVIFELSGSSISYWSAILPNVEPDSVGTLFHSANNYRSDEFGINTIFAIAQDKNVYQNFPYFSDIVRGTNTDMFIVYGQPVMHYGILFRPFQIGYLLLGSSRGLSFFWCGRLIALIMVSFEFGMMITKGKKPLSVIYSLLVSFSPAICWWFAINGFVEMLVFGQLCALFLAKYMQDSDWKKRIAYCMLFFWSGGCYILVFYPAWQVILGYVFLAIFIWVIISNAKNFKWNFKKDLPIILISAVIIGGLLLSLLYKSRDTIAAVMNTAYPGKRVSVERLDLKELFAYGYNLFLPVVQGDNVSSWVFIDFFPLGILAALYVIFFEKKRDKLLICLLAVQAFMIIMYVAPVPVALIKITMLSQVPSFRMIIGVGLVNILLLIRSIMLIEKKNKYIIAAISVVFSIILCYVAKKAIMYFNCTRPMIAAMFVFFAVGAYAFLAYNGKAVRNIIITAVICVIVLDGFMVNPVQKGLDFVFENDLVKKINAIAKEDDGRWVVEVNGYPANNLPLLAGAKTFNSSNVYPQIDTWKKIDPDGANEEIYNRYAHITTEIVPDDQAGFELIQADYMKVKFKVADLKTLDIKYVLTLRELEDFSNDEVQFSKVDTSGQYYIYSVNY